MRIIRGSYFGNIEIYKMILESGVLSVEYNIKRYRISKGQKYSYISH